MPLTDAQIRAASARAKAYKVFDGGGLYLLVTRKGQKYWRLKYRFAKREGKLAFGVYPKVSLREAREQRDEAKKLLRKGIDPAVQRQLVGNALVVTFRLVAEEWLTMLSKPRQVRARKGKPQPEPRPPLSPATIEKKREWLERFVYPYLGNRPIAQITAPELLAVLRRIENEGIIETLHRVRSTCSRIFRYGIATHRCERDVAADLLDALPPVVVTHHPALTEPQEVAGLLRAIDKYRGQPVTRAALQLRPMVFTRSTEFRWARWREIILEGEDPHWRVPGRRMKKREMHVVPLPTQAVRILSELRPLTDQGPDSLVFEGLRPKRPISENTLNAALRRMGYSGEEMVDHGWRTVASTFLNEQGWHPDLIELSLAHTERDEVRATYNRAQRLLDRKKMLQAWADYLDALKAGGNVVAFRSRAG